MNLECEIEVWSDVEHLKQIYTGYGLLHRRGFLRLTQVIPPMARANRKDPNRWTDYRFFITRVTVNGSISIVYDLHDWNRIDEETLSGSDFYFKRSFDARYVSELRDANKVYPLGLNYPVSTSHTDIFKLRRASLHAGMEMIKAVAKGLRLDRLGVGPGETERLDNLEALPDFESDPRVLFMAKVWDPERIESKTQKEAVEEINQVRAECVRVLRSEFKDRFFGGLAHDDYAVRCFADCLLPDAGLSNKRNYLEMLKSYPICVATTGLNGSNGWKLGEYVAFAKAIITEPLLFDVPGDFNEAKNYLAFSTPRDLAGQAAKLLENKVLRFDMMMNNLRYYRNYVRPDAMILNSLATVFGFRS